MNNNNNNSTSDDETSVSSSATEVCEPPLRPRGGFRPRAPTEMWGPVRLFREANLGDARECIQWGVDRGILAGPPVHKCRVPAYLRMPEGRSAFWYDGKCRRQAGSPFAGTVWEGARLPFARALMLGLCYAQGAGYDEARRACVFGEGDTPLTNSTIARWYRKYRRAISGAARAPGPVGGPGHIVQVDEALIHGRRKYGRGRCNTQVWVLGVVDDEGHMRLGVVRNRSRPELFRFLRRWIRPGSEIHTDGWRAYRGLERLGFTHRVVNHREAFVAPDGAHTQRIESLWRSIRRKFSRGGIRARDVSVHLREWLWRRACRQRGEDPFGSLLRLLRRA